MNESFSPNGQAPLAHDGQICSSHALQMSSVTPAYNSVGNGNLSPTALSPALEQIPTALPKNKSTGNLLGKQQDASSSADGKRTRASFDSGSAKEIHNLKRSGGAMATLQFLSHCAYQVCTGTQDSIMMAASQPPAYVEYEELPPPVRPLSSWKTTSS